MLCTIDERPESAGVFRLTGCAAKQLGADAEQDAPAKLQTIGLRFAPWERLQQRQPGVFQPR